MRPTVINIFRMTDISHAQISDLRQCWLLKKLHDIAYCINQQNIITVGNTNCKLTKLQN